MRFGALALYVEVRAQRSQTEYPCCQCCYHVVHYNTYSLYSGDGLDNSASGHCEIHNRMTSRQQVGVTHAGVFLDGHTYHADGTHAADRHSADAHRNQNAPYLLLRQGNVEVYPGKRESVKMIAVVEQAAVGSAADNTVDFGQ